MTSPHYAELAAKLLARDQEGPDEAPPAPTDRARAIGAIEFAIRRKAQQRLRSRWIIGVSAAAAVALVGFGGTKLAIWNAQQSGVAAATGTATQQPTSAAPAVTVVGHASGEGATVIGSGASSPLADGKTLTVGSRVVARPMGRAMSRCRVSRLSHQRRQPTLSLRTICIARPEPPPPNAAEMAD